MASLYSSCIPSSYKDINWVTPYSLVYEMEAMIPLEVEIPSLRVLIKSKLGGVE